jgi:hypothetical protein
MPRIDEIIAYLRPDAEWIMHNESIEELVFFNESIEPLDKMKFIGFGMKYKILQNWGDVNDWLRSSFGNLVL